MSSPAFLPAASTQKLAVPLQAVRAVVRTKLSERDPAPTEQPSQLLGSRLLRTGFWDLSPDTLSKALCPCESWR